MRGKGEGSVFKDRATGLWTAIVELPPRDGKRRRKTIRRKNKRDVVNELSALREELRLRGDLPTNGQTVAQWFTYWYNDIATKKNRPNTLAGYRASVFNHIIPTIGHVKLDRLTAAHIRRVHDAITDRGLSTTTALLAHRVMAASLKIAVREGRIGRNPANLTDAPRKAFTDLEALSLDETLHVLQHVATIPNGARWAAALLTGARRGEVLALQRDRVTDVLDLSWQLQRLKRSPSGAPLVPSDFEYRHLENGLFLTRPKSTKGWRIIPLVDPLKSILESHIATEPPNPFGLVFTRGGHPIDPDKDSKSWRAVLEQTDINKDVRLHDLRHTAADLLYLAGVSEADIMDILGHSVRAVTRGYKSKWNQERLTRAMETFSVLFSQPDGSRSDTPEASDR